VLLAGCRWEFPEISQTLLAFVDRCNLRARPFNWKFSAHDLTALLRRISQHKQGSSSQQARPVPGRLVTPDELTGLPT
jgi:hypothetical protein